MIFNKTDAFLKVTFGDIQTQAIEAIGRELSRDEMIMIVDDILIDWKGPIQQAIIDCKEIK